MQKTNHSKYSQVSKGRVIFILLLFISTGLKAQFYEYGQDAGTLKWYHFNTPNYQIIYPKGADSLSTAFARRLDYYYPYVGAPLDHRHSQIPVIIHNESSFSNGVFVWAPKRLEIFTNPDPNGFHQDWLTQLAIHEGRHAVQIDKLNQGVTKAFSLILGEQAAGAAAVFLPYWYLEGDAVDAETRLSNTGRGRQPSFEMEIKAQMLESGKVYSFSKATMGSYKDYIPNHYKLGYLMLRYGRMEYGNKLWIDFQQYAARKPYLLNPTFFSMKKYGIKSKNQFYLDALASYRQHWSEQAAHRERTPVHHISLNQSKHYTSYSFLQPVSGTLAFAYKTGIDHIPEFIFLGKEGEEKRIFRPGILSSGKVNFSGKHLVWDEFIPDTRWSNRNYSVIKILELGTGKVSSLGRKTRFYSPDLSHDGSKIVVVEQSVGQKFSLVIMGIDGSIKDIIPSPDNRFLQHPAWMEKDTALVVLLSEDKGKALYRYGLGSGEWDKIFEAGYNDISNPEVHEQRIFFSGTFSGIDNIYCLDLTENMTYQITSSRFGAFQPSVSADGKELFYSDYSANGYRATLLPISDGLWKPLSKSIDHSEQLDHEQTPEEIEVISNAEKADKLDYSPRKYSKALHLFKFHSWLPLYFDYLNPELSFNPEHLPINPGASLVSQNHLSTAVSQLGYEYRNGFHMFHSGIKLKGRYPIFNLTYNYGGEPNVLLLDEGDSIIDLPTNMRFTAQTYVPIRLNTGKFLSIIQPRIDYTYRRDVQYVENENAYRAGAHYLYYSLYSSAYLRRGKRDILPRIGFIASGGYYHAPFNNQVYGAVAHGGLTLYIPGFLKHQTIRGSIQIQRQYPRNMNRPAFINLIGLPRGLYGIFGEDFTKYSVDYVMPLLYPDLELSGLIYVKRIRGAVWLDHLVGKNVIIRDPNPYYDDKAYTTLGIDLIADINVMRISFPLSIGGRMTYEPLSGDVGFEAVYSIDLN